MIEGVRARAVYRTLAEDLDEPGDERGMRLIARDRGCTERALRKEHTAASAKNTPRLAKMRVTKAKNEGVQPNGLQDRTRYRKEHTRE